MRSNTDFSNRMMFENVAESYDQARPTYPNELFETLFDVAKIDSNSSLLEVGAGSGQATLSLARRGCQIIALEPGVRLAAIAGEKLKKYGNVRFVVEDFESFNAKPGSFDCVVSANAFHWVNPNIGYRKAYSLLAKEGHIALFWNFPQLDQATEALINDLLRQHDSTLVTEDSESKIERTLADGAEELHQSGMFESVTEYRFPWNDMLTANSYTKLLETYANYAALPVSKRERIFSEIHDLITRRFGGQIQLHNFAALRIARKKLNAQN